MGSKNYLRIEKRGNITGSGYNDPLVLALIYYNTRLEQGDSYI